MGNLNNFCHLTYSFTDLIINSPELNFFIFLKYNAYLYMNDYL